jgi:hypothetical protein
MGLVFKNSEFWISAGIIGAKLTLIGLAGIVTGLFGTVASVPFFAFPPVGPIVGSVVMVGSFVAIPIFFVVGCSGVVLLGVAGQNYDKMKAFAKEEAARQ